MNEEDNVLEAEVWVIRYFQSENKSRDKLVIQDIAISCPTKPPSYVHIENLKKPERVSVIIIENISDRYEFGTEYALDVVHGKFN
mgnify:CR=1 FL=1